MNLTPESHDVNGFSVQVVREQKVTKLLWVQRPGRPRAEGHQKLLLSGELDMDTVSLLEDHLRTEEAVGARPISIDLGFLTFMDSSGLHAFIRASQRAEARGNRLALATVQTRSDGSSNSQV